MWQLLYDGGRLLGKLQRERHFSGGIIASFA